MYGSRKACGQLPLGSGDWDTGISLPLSRTAERSSHVNIPFDSGNDKWSCFIVRESRNSSNDQNGGISSTERVCPACCGWLQGPFGATPPGVPTTERDVRLSTLFFPYSVSSDKQHFKWHLRESESLSYWDHSGPASPGAKQLEYWGGF